MTSPEVEKILEELSCVGQSDKEIMRSVALLLGNLFISSESCCAEINAALQSINGLIVQANTKIDLLNTKLQQLVDNNNN